MDYTTQTPGQLAGELLQLAAKYERLSDEYSEILTVKNTQWPMIRITVTSDKQADRIWATTNNGAREQQIELQLKTIQRTMSSIKTYLQVKEGEARNYY